LLRGAAATAETRSDRSTEVAEDVTDVPEERRAFLVRESDVAQPALAASPSLRAAASHGVRERSTQLGPEEAHGALGIEVRSAGGLGDHGVDDAQREDVASGDAEGL